MSERAEATTMGAASGYGSRVIVTAYPGRFQERMNLIIGMLFLGGLGSAILVFKPRGDAPAWFQAVMSCLLLGGALVCCGLYGRTRYWTRRGGPVPRLYCFEGGFVLAREGALRPYGWGEVRVDSKKWLSGPVDDRTLRSRDIITASDGSVLADFSDEYDRTSGIGTLRLLKVLWDAGREEPTS
ncbi:hypothetical protein ACFXJ5_22110 [Streptomyces sp. NPDC059373]